MRGERGKENAKEKKNYFSCNLGFSISLPNRNELVACQRERTVRGKGKEREKERKKVAASITLLSVIVGGQNKQGDDIIKPETE